jgi:hypothetical protein
MTDRQNDKSTTPVDDVSGIIFENVFILSFHFYVGALKH